MYDISRLRVNCEGITKQRREVFCSGRKVHERRERILR